MLHKSIVTSSWITFLLTKKLFRNLNVSSEEMSGYVVKDGKLGPDRKKDKTSFSLKIISKSFVLVHFNLITVCRNTHLVKRISLWKVSKNSRIFLAALFYRRICLEAIS